MNSTERSDTPEERLERLTAACDEKQRKITELKQQVQTLRKSICCSQIKSLDLECEVTSLDLEVTTLKSSISCLSQFHYL